VTTGFPARVGHAAVERFSAGASIGSSSGSSVPSSRRNGTGTLVTALPPGVTAGSGTAIEPVFRKVSAE
jgi:hypothetical protein